ncbi:MAG: hypothetical protein ACN6OP_14490 [Pseudomonadales bacterium]
MRSVLYFRLGDIAAAKRIQAKVREITAAPVHMGGPWFIQRDNKAIDGLPNAEASQTTYREEWAMAGAFCGTTLAVLAILHFGTSAGTFASVVACVGGSAIGALSGWRLGGLADGLAHAFGGAGSPGGKRSLRKEKCCLLQLAARKQRNP